MRGEERLREKHAKRPATVPLVLAPTPLCVSERNHSAVEHCFTRFREKCEAASVYSTTIPLNRAQGKSVRAPRTSALFNGIVVE